MQIGTCTARLTCSILETWFQVHSQGFYPGMGPSRSHLISGAGARGELEPGKNSCFLLLPHANRKPTLRYDSCCAFSGTSCKNGNVVRLTFIPVNLSTHVLQIQSSPCLHSPVLSSPVRSTFTASLDVNGLVLSLTPGLRNKFIKSKLCVHIFKSIPHPLYFSTETSWYVDSCRYQTPDV